MEMNKADNTQYKPVLPEMPKRVLINFSTSCNLRCPHCFLHGNEKERKKLKHGLMKPEQVKGIIDEIAPFRSLVQPNLWSEPLLLKHLKKYISWMKEKDIPVNMNTNGLLLTEDLARFFRDVKLDTILFSVDALTKETQYKVRGITNLDQLISKIDMMIDIRGNSLYPRLGTSFTVTDDNRHETDDFVSYWLKKVDLVRVGLVLEKEIGFYLKPGIERTPCPMLYDTMPIQVNGDVSICCLDSLGEFIVGNVFSDGGLKAVWHGDMFNEVRQWHESGDFGKLQLCARCNLWAGQSFEEEEKDGILIRRSVQYTYYNRIDRMGSWTR